MPFEFGDILLVPFPFTSHTAFKKRPAVVASSRAYNDVRPDVIVLAVTSQLRATPGRFDVAIARWREAGLLKPSAVKPVFATIEQALILRRLGALDAPDQNALHEAIKEMLG
jgi:mRNA interferase MazF